MEQLRDDLRSTNIGTSTLVPGMTQTNIGQSETHRPESLKNAQAAAPQRPLVPPPGAAGRPPQRPPAAKRSRPLLGAPAGSADRRPPGRERHRQQRPVRLPRA
jgi:hypothetical protein